MIEIDPIIIMAMGEALLILLIIVIVMAILAMKRISNDKKAVETLVGKLKENRSNRDEKVRCMLNGKYHYKDENLDSSVRKFSKSERRFYQAFIKTYLNRDYKKLSKLDIEFDRATTPYFEIELPNRGDEGAEKEKDELLTKLKEDNKKLKEELGVSMKTLGRMLGEYANILDEEKQEAKSIASEEVVEDKRSDSSVAEASLSPTLMKELSESEAIEATENEGLLEISEAELDDDTPAAELLEVEEEQPAHGITPDRPIDATSSEASLETENETPSESESLEIVDDTDEPAADSVDELLESIQTSVEDEGDRDDEISEEVLEDLDKVAHEIDELVIEETEETPELGTDVDDIDTLIEASSTHTQPEVSKEHTDDLIDELQKAQDLGQEIENLIDMEQNLDAPSTEDDGKKD